jgi:hypothetical protein
VTGAASPLSGIVCVGPALWPRQLGRRAITRLAPVFVSMMWPRLEIAVDHPVAPRGIEAHRRSRWRSAHTCCTGSNPGLSAMGERHASQVPSPDNPRRPGGGCLKAGTCGVAQTGNGLGIPDEAFGPLERCSGKTLMATVRLSRVPRAGRPNAAGTARRENHCGPTWWRAPQAIAHPFAGLFSALLAAVRLHPYHKAQVPLARTCGRFRARREHLRQLLTSPNPGRDRSEGQSAQNRPGSTGAQTRMQVRAVSLQTGCPSGLDLPA